MLLLNNKPQHNDMMQNKLKEKEKQNLFKKKEKESISGLTRF
jgi:hypothetical protein